MKANETPTKIYISTNSQDDTYYISNQYKRFIEYIRTDAFIEKAIKWLKQNADKYTWYNEFEGESGMIEEFTNDFQKAMNYGSTS